MTYLNIIALAGTVGFMVAILRLYLPTNWVNKASLLGILALTGVVGPKLGHPDLGILRLFAISGFLYQFLAWNRFGSSGLKYAGLASCFLSVAMASSLERGYLGFTWLVLTGFGSVWLNFWIQIRTKNRLLSTPDSITLRLFQAFKKGAIVAGMALVLSFPIQWTLQKASLLHSKSISPAQGFYNITVPVPRFLGDISPPLETVGNKDLLWALAWKNLHAQPKNAFQKWRANVNRMIFDFPYTHSTGHPAAAGTGNGAFGTSMLLFWVCLSIYPWMRGFQKVPPEISLVFIWMGLGLGIRSFFSAGSDALLPWVSGFIIVSIVTINRTLQIGIRTGKSVESST